MDGMNAQQRDQTFTLLVASASRYQSPSCYHFYAQWVIIQAFTGRRPFYDKPALMIVSSILTGEKTSRPADEEGVIPEPAWQFMLQCWEKDKDSRPKAADALLVFASQDQTQVV